MKKSIKVLIGIGLFLIIVFTVYYFYSKKSAANNTQLSVRYIPQRVVKQDISVKIKSTGIVFAGTTKEVVAKNSGEVKSLNVKVKDTVKEGETLLTVYNDQIDSQITSAEINIEKLNLQLSNAKSDDEKKLINLQLKEAKNNLANLKKQKSEMTIKSPISGVVTAVNVNNGDNVQSGKTLVTIVDPKSLKIKASIDELDIAKVSIGQRVNIKINALEDKAFIGKVEEISDIGTTQNNVTSYDVVVSIQNPEGIKLGMTASIEIDVQSKKDALLIPIEALQEINGKKYVLLQEQNVNTQTNDQNSQSSNIKARSQGRQFGFTEGNGRLVEIKTGLRNDSFIEVVEGLKEGDVVLVKVSTSTNSNTIKNNFRNNSMRMLGMDGGMGGPGGAPQR
ncbi:efflux RND transporter periplasmic adaptor subunit [Thermobrachium celere]|uniref:Membrane permease, predicted cation efflux pumps n=1 Tax=Thermobrachium celere DSM 8682 TaxID=941824 RepID=R7RQG8_9CLOT|nr:efflux RND transporter periplasmic adaptor subunit [Thermobrachium celere]CDF57490.1 Membrane permease, predicted cation efflux pumps [Thermobrachium celere DSM 8682]